ncbi:hypothetical protein Tsubulata_018573 [Turnera subulata]|uniref:Uncharacterized protein n=1 Tax=Turnera subulata TaxID=218843 RepID=A0A9Q0JIM1_9ROSI|nr:hypothetical protein Tsubulata_018573 [Turnera subulata]
MMDKETATHQNDDQDSQPTPSAEKSNHSHSGSWRTSRPPPINVPSMPRAAMTPHNHHNSQPTSPSPSPSTIVHHNNMQDSPAAMHHNDHHDTSHQRTPSLENSNRSSGSWRTSRPPPINVSAMPAAAVMPHNHHNSQPTSDPSPIVHHNNMQEAPAAAMHHNHVQYDATHHPIASPNLPSLPYHYQTFSTHPPPNSAINHNMHHNNNHTSHHPPSPPMFAYNNNLQGQMMMHPNYHHDHTRQLSPNYLFLSSPHNHQAPPIHHHNFHYNSRPATPAPFHPTQGAAAMHHHQYHTNHINNHHIIPPALSPTPAMVASSPTPTISPMAETQPTSSFAIYHNGSFVTFQQFALLHPQGQWTTGLCDCCDDYENCWRTFFCSCVTFGRNAEIISAGATRRPTSCLLYCGMRLCRASSIYGAENRSNLRRLLSLPEVPWSDYCVHCFFSLCAHCQEHRELKNRGADPSLGWEGNVEKWQNEGLVPPVIVPRMTR